MNKPHPDPGGRNNISPLRISPDNSQDLKSQGYISKWSMTAHNEMLDRKRYSWYKASEAMLCVKFAHGKAKKGMEFASGLRLKKGGIQ